MCGPVFVFQSFSVVWVFRVFFTQKTSRNHVAGVSFGSCYMFLCI